MIRINLLPEEFRRSERTSPKLFAAVLLAVMMVCGSVGWFGFVYFGELKQLEVENARLDEQLASKAQSVRYFEDLKAERADYQQREKTIEEIGRSRVLWTPILDQLIDVIDNDHDAQRHLAWFKSLDVRDASDKKSGPKLSMPGWVQGDQLSFVANFHDDIERAPFFGHVKSKGAPTAKRNDDATRRPPEALAFTLDLDFLPAEKWGEAAPAK